MTSPKQKRAPAKSALQSAKLTIKYHALGFLAKLFEKPFWFFEQRRCRIMIVSKTSGATYERRTTN